MLRYAITPGELPIDGVGPILDQLLVRCEALAEVGVEYILVREKHLAARELEGVVRAVVGRVRGSGTRVIVAGAVGVALATGADGVHVGASLELVARVREALGGAWVSASCHTLDEVRGARAVGVDGILFAPVFGKVVDGVEVVPGVGLERLREACVAAGEVSVFALGGMTEGNAAECIDVGARGIAGIRIFFE